MVCYLLGIRKANQLKRDPLRGSIYENLIITEVLKYRLNRGMDPDLFFYRDSHGSEVDLIIRESGKLNPVEIKSANTFTPDFIKGIHSFRKATGDKCTDGTVVYNGRTEYSFKGNRIINPFYHSGFDLLNK